MLPSPFPAPSGGTCRNFQMRVRPVHDLLGAERYVHPMGAEPWKLRDIDVGLSRRLKATPVFDTYWRFAARRQELFMHRTLGWPPEALALATGDAGRWEGCSCGYQAIAG